MTKTNVTGIKRIINAAGYSWLGIKAAFTHESAFRQELGLFTILTPVALYFGPNIADKALLRTIKRQPCFYISHRNT